MRPQELRDPRMLDLTFDPRLGAFTTPTFVLWGVQDRVNPAGGGSSLQERMRNCALYLFSRTGHCVQWERAAAFNAPTSQISRKPDPKRPRKVIVMNAMNTPTRIAGAKRTRTSVYGAVRLGNALIDSPRLAEHTTRTPVPPIGEVLPDGSTCSARARRSSTASNCASAAW